MPELHRMGRHVLWEPANWHRTNGAVPHMVLPFVGERIAVIAYYHDAALRADAVNVRNAATLLGFPETTDQQRSQMADDHGRAKRRCFAERVDVRQYVDLCDAASDMFVGTDFSELQAEFEAEEVLPRAAHQTPSWMLPRPMMAFFLLCGNLWRGQGQHLEQQAPTYHQRPPSPSLSASSAACSWNALLPCAPLRSRGLASVLGLAAPCW